MKSSLTLFASLITFFSLHGQDCDPCSLDIQIGWATYTMTDSTIKFSWDINYTSCIDESVFDDQSGLCWCQLENFFSIDTNIPGQSISTGWVGMDINSWTIEIDLAELHEYNYIEYDLDINAGHYCTTSCMNLLDGCYAQSSMYDFLIAGCTDPYALNYDHVASIETGFCEYECPDEPGVNLTMQTDCFGEQTAWNITNSDGEIVAQAIEGSYPGNTEDPYTWPFYLLETYCLPLGCYTFTMTDTNGDGLEGSSYDNCNRNGSFSCSDTYGVLLFESGEAVFEDSISFNFCLEPDPFADNDEDGFSIADGDCDDTNPDINPNTYPICDDQVPYDTNQDNIINTSDLLYIVSQYGVVGNNLPYDLDGNGIISIGDIIEWLGNVNL